MLLCRKEDQINYTCHDKSIFFKCLRKWRFYSLHCSVVINWYREDNVSREGYDKITTKLKLPNLPSKIFGCSHRATRSRTAEIYIWQHRLLKVQRPRPLGQLLAIYKYIFRCLEHYAAHRDLHSFSARCSSDKYGTAHLCVVMYDIGSNIFFL